MFHVEHFSAKGPLRVETSSARKLLCLWRIADGSRRPRCSTWNILSVADVPRGTFSSFADVPRGNTFRQRPPTVRLSLPLRQREKAWAVPNGLAALEDPDVPRGTF